MGRVRKTHLMLLLPQPIHHRDEGLHIDSIRRRNLPPSLSINDSDPLGEPRTGRNQTVYLPLSCSMAPGAPLFAGGLHQHFTVRLHLSIQLFASPVPNILTTSPNTHHSNVATPPKALLNHEQHSRLEGRSRGRNRRLSPFHLLSEKQPVPSRKLLAFCGSSFHLVIGISGMSDRRSPPAERI